MAFCPNCALVFPHGTRICPLDGSELSERTDPFEGIVLAGKYRVVERIGMGGMGYVYRGQHVHMDRDVAIKILPVEAASSLDVSEIKARFTREARAADLVRHRNIVQVYEIGESRKNISYIVMELLQGRTLEDVIAARKITVGLVISIMRQVLGVLGPTHAMGIIHRDLKPENVFLTKEGGKDDFVKILDFGVAHLASEPGLTVAGQVLGTPEYMSPEQARGEKPGPHSDLYALGCIAYDMAAGHPPFRKGNMMEIMRQQIAEKPAPLCDVQPKTPPELARIVMRLIEKRPEDRYLDAFAVLADLDAFVPPNRAAQAVVPRDSRLDFGDGGSLEAQAGPASPPPLLAAWKRFVAQHATAAAEDRRRVVYEMGELVGQLESLVGMMEGICAMMESSVEERRHEGRRIRHAIAKFAKSASLKRSSLVEQGQRFEVLATELAELDLQILEHLNGLKAMETVHGGDALDDSTVQACAALGRSALCRQQVAADMAEAREQARALTEQISQTEAQVCSLRERLEGVIQSSADRLAEQQQRIESLEQERFRIESRLCELAASLSA